MKRLLTLVAVAILAGCATGRNYARPPVNVPEAFRGQTEQPTAASLADAKWWELFEDEQLQALISAALDGNYDVRIAAARILEAEAQLGVTRADELPSATASGTVLGQKPSAALFGSQARSVLAIALQGSASWQLDFWGRYRRATEA